MTQSWLKDQREAVAETEELLGSKGKMSEEVFMDRVDRIVELSKEADSALISVEEEGIAEALCIANVDKCATAIERISVEIEKINKDLEELESSYEGTGKEYKRKREELVKGYRKQSKQLQGSLEALKYQLFRSTANTKVDDLIEQARGDLALCRGGVVGLIKNVATSIFGYGKWPLERKIKALGELQEKLKGIDSGSSAHEPIPINLLREKRTAEKKTEELLGGGLFFKGKMNPEIFENRVEGIIEISRKVDSILGDVVTLSQKEPLTTEDTKSCIKSVDKCRETILSIDAEIKKIEKDLGELRSSYDKTGKGYKGKRQELIGTYEESLKQMQQALSGYKQVLASGSGKKAVDESLKTVQSSLDAYKGGVASYLWNVAKNVFGHGYRPLQEQKKDLIRLQEVLREMREEPQPPVELSGKHTL